MNQTKLNELFQVNELIDDLTEKRHELIKGFSERITKYLCSKGHNRFDTITGIEEFDDVNLSITTFEAGYGGDGDHEEHFILPKHLLDDEEWAKFLAQLEIEQKEKDQAEIRRKIAAHQDCITSLQAKL